MDVRLRQTYLRWFFRDKENENHSNDDEVKKNNIFSSTKCRLVKLNKLYIVNSDFS